MVVGQIIARPRTQFLCLAHVTVLMSFVAMYSALGPHLGSIGMSQSQLIWLRLAGLPSMCVSLIIGRIAARIPIGTIARVSFIVASLVFVAGIAMAVPTMSYAVRPGFGTLSCRRHGGQRCGAVYWRQPGPTCCPPARRSFDAHVGARGRAAAGLRVCDGFPTVIATRRAVMTDLSQVIISGVGFPFSSRG